VCERAREPLNLHSYNPVWIRNRESYRLREREREMGSREGIVYSRRRIAESWGKYSLKMRDYSVIILY